MVNFYGSTPSTQRKIGIQWQLQLIMILGWLALFRIDTLYWDILGKIGEYQYLKGIYLPTSMVG